MKTLSVSALFVLAAALPAAAQSLTRGPYLQQGSQNGVVVRWRTGSATNSRVRIGTALATPLPTVVDSAASTTEHVVTLTGLAADTKYYYSVGSTTATYAGPDANHFFVTSPTPGVAKPTRIWVIGDAGTGSSQQTQVRDAYYAYTGTRHTDLWIQLGDNAYNDGTDAEYTTKVFDVYGAMFRKSVAWSTLGNHDGHSADSVAQTGPYYSIFTFPKNGECGGLASGTEAYYSFDYGNIHFICLESYGILGNSSAKSAMKTWVTNDVNATTREWIIAYWHHPPYSKGSHDSDTESGLVTMRAEFNPILEGAGVDLVLSGHSHSYERSFLLNGHYGSSGTLTAAMKVDPGSGRDPAPYAKSGDDGAVYVVAGSSGKVSGGSLNHPAMYLSLNNLGSMVIDVDGSRLDARFIRENGSIADYFAIVKGTPPPPLPAVTVTAPDASASEAGPDTGRFRLTRTGSTSSSLTVAFILGGTASSGADFAALTSPVTIPAGSATLDLTVTPVNDASAEASETLILTLAAAAGYTLGSPVAATVTILDNDTAGDSDGDGLPDAWETTHFGNLGQGAGGDFDSDGATNLEEYQAGTDPADPASTPAPPASGGGSDGGDEGLCGALGAEAFLVLLLRRRHSASLKRAENGAFQRR